MCVVAFFVSQSADDFVSSTTIAPPAGVACICLHCYFMPLSSLTDLCYSVNVILSELVYCTE